MEQMINGTLSTASYELCMLCYCIHQLQPHGHPGEPLGDGRDVAAVELVGGVDPVAVPLRPVHQVLNSRNVLTKFCVKNSLSTPFIYTIPYLEHCDAEGMVEVSVGVEHDPGVRAIDVGGGDRVELGVHPVQSVTGTL